MSFGTLAAILFLALLSWNNFIRGYANPPNFFWDENYHIASAQKYLHGVFFMEPHPPLGKLLIALGEKLLHPNPETDQFINTSYATSEHLPEGFSFQGYRLFPVLFSSICPLLMFILLLLLTSEIWISVAGGTLLALDNALLVHLRGAMLEGFQLCFLLIALISFALLIRPASSRRRRLLALLFGSALGLLLGIKINGAVAFMLFPMLLWKWRNAPARFSEVAGLSVLSFLFVTAAIWQIHFSLARTINPELEKAGYFSASVRYQAVLRDGRQASLSELPLNLREAWRYFKKYEDGVPKLNLCKETENGSPFYLWPIGARSISYRWERKENLVQYLYLQVNPVIWFVALLGPILALTLIGARAFYRQLPALLHGEALVQYLVLYLGYMLAVGLIPRVMYLYHYFIPLLFSLILLALVFAEIECIGSIVLNERRKRICAVAYTTLAAIGFLIYYPLTYFTPVSNEWLAKRGLLSIWDLQCWNCPPTNTFAKPFKETKKPKVHFEHLLLSGLRPISGQQAWGEPALDVAVGGGEISIGGKEFASGFGVHALSTLVYSLSEKYRRFTAEVGLTDDVAPGSGSVVFEVYADSTLLYRSPVMASGMSAIPVDVSLAGKKTLRLQVLDAGDGNDFDHAAWGNPRLE